MRERKGGPKKAQDLDFIQEHTKFRINKQVTLALYIYSFFF